jgi:Putative collagen-binding domain of a collagenase
MAGPTRARWFNPTNGVYQDIGAGYTNGGRRAFRSPGNNGSGANDWVLVLDAEGAGDPRWGPPRPNIGVASLQKATNAPATNVPPKVWIP